jgi:flagellar basal-body rod protein FlgF
MQNALLVGLSRQVALARELDVVANNIANLNTAGFKSDSAVFEEYVSPTARFDNFLNPDRRVSFVQDRATWIDLSQGPPRIFRCTDTAGRALRAQRRIPDQQ